LQSVAGGTVTFTGPQAQSSWGAKVTHRFSSSFKAGFEYAASRYSPDTAKAFVTTPAQTGHMWRVEAEGALTERGAYKIEYISVDPNYDPFILGYPGGAIVR